LAHLKTIAIDAMGGDHGPKVTLPAVIRALKEFADLRIVLVGQEAVLERYLKKLLPKGHPRLTIRHASETVEMDELPSQALRGKKDSSMRVAINLVKSKEADACVSAGNTGALMATARFVLKTLPGIDRPAIMSVMPRMSGGVTRMLDLGASIDNTPEHLMQFALMASVLTKALSTIEAPRVALLNIGTEEIKGNELVKKTAELLQQCENINYVGYAEGGDSLIGNFDVIVTDGFAGNIALKAMEGAAKAFKHFMMQGFKRNLFTKLAFLIISPVMYSIKKSVDPDNYNGASLLGLNGIVVKSHGGTKVFGFYRAITEAYYELDKGVIELLTKEISKILIPSEG
jgi:glycerol-3-phosphate acyltransferase PlsX